MLEPDVALTDFLLVAQNGAFAVLLARKEAGNHRLRLPFAAFFSALAASALFGGIWHGFFSSGKTELGSWIWLATMTALAVAAAAVWLIAAACLLSEPWKTRLRALAAVQLIGQTLVSALVSDAFLVGAIGILPAIVVLGIIYVRAYLATRLPRLLTGLAGLALAILSGLVILYGLSLHRVWLTPNAVYHLLQFLACWLVFSSVRALGAAAR